MLFSYDPKNPKTDKLLEYLRECSVKKEIYVSDPKRSQAQNRLFHANAGILAKYSGNTVDEMKYILKHGITDAKKLGMVRYIIVKGKPIPVYESTADLTKEEFSILMDYVYDIGNVLNLQMNYPGEQQEDIAKFAQELFE